jgi:hypothetical protein
MSNPFSGVITQGFKDLHTNMITSLLYDDACTVSCVLEYEGSLVTDCPNCIENVLMGRSASVYQAGGPVPFTHGDCPYCGGRGRIDTAQEESIYIMPIWSSKDWIGTASDASRAPDVDLQTMTVVSNYTKIETANFIRVDTEISGYGTNKFVRQGDSEPCGLGSSSFIITNWKKVS